MVSKYVSEKEYIQCELCSKFATYVNAEKLGWDWFTGTLDRTYHYCQQHKTSKQRNELFRISRLPKEVATNGDKR